MAQDLDPNEEPIFKVMLPLPTRIPYGKGIASTTGPNGCLLQCRGTIQEKAKIERAAEKLGITYAHFIRRAMNDMADVVLAMDLKSHDQSAD